MKTFKKAALIFTCACFFALSGCQTKKRTNQTPSQEEVDEEESNITKQLEIPLGEDQEAGGI